MAPNWNFNKYLIDREGKVYKGYRSKVKPDSEMLINAIERWREKWEDQDTESYLKFYSKNFFSQKDNYDSWAERKRIIQAQKQKVFVGLSEISFFDYPNTENEMVLVDFIQDYKSPTINNKMNKRQYWINENNEWRIMYEGGA